MLTLLDRGRGWAVTVSDGDRQSVPRPVAAARGLEDGSELRLGYAGKNGREYTSLGGELVALLPALWWWRSRRRRAWSG